jgi:hypothetical protein
MYLIYNKIKHNNIKQTTFEQTKNTPNFVIPYFRVINVNYLVLYNMVEKNFRKPLMKVKLT